MNPLFSLIIVIIGLLIFLKLLQWIINKTPHFASFGKKRSQPYLSTEDIQILNQFALDPQYKIVTIMLGQHKHTFLLGPTQAIKLDNPIAEGTDSTKVFPLKPYIDKDKK
ncbi:MAG: hypothetical protein COY39_05985 [Alphaproteobacteria bacterium CG_4_10_14_0_8_um_filter_37_21]|nr:MAG: hypothetical protein COY39_05985 [Alphaproteobacteria bacterium CG_4_10_14_0_8_um_filter_37_21]